MDALITASARALATGDALGALKHVALRDDPPALALRGIAMAQLCEYPRARELLRQATKGFGAHEALAHARCVVAEAEVALAMRDLGDTPPLLTTAIHTLEARGDHANATQARLIALRRLVLLGRLEEAAAELSQLDERALPPALHAVSELARAEIALRSLDSTTAQVALVRASMAAERARVPALQAEVAEAQAWLQRPAARCLSANETKVLRIGEVETLLQSGALVLDACRHGLRVGPSWLPLASRPVLFELAYELAKAWPGGADRQALIAQVFRTRHPDETHRARLRVEIGRLRALIADMARIEATPKGFMLQPTVSQQVLVLAPPVDGDQASLLALLSDGAPWSTSALALALGTSQRSVQRALADLEAAGRVRSIGLARARRWLSPPMTGFTTILLLPTALPSA